MIHWFQSFIVSKPADIPVVGIIGHLVFCKRKVAGWNPHNDQFSPGVFWFGFYDAERVSAKPDRGFGLCFHVGRFSSGIPHHTYHRPLCRLAACQKSGTAAVWAERGVGDLKIWRFEDLKMPADLVLSLIINVIVIISPSPNFQIFKSSNWFPCILSKRSLI